MRFAPAAAVLALMLTQPLTPAHAATSSSDRKATETLARLCSEFGEAHLLAHPVAATGIGDHR